MVELRSTPWMIQRIGTQQEYWDQVVVPDYSDFIAKIDDLRMAFHCAISLFHMHDWIYITHKLVIDQSFQFKNRKTGALTPVSDEIQFANAIEDVHPDFVLVREIANTAKHLSLRNVSSHAARTVVMGTGWGEGSWGQGPYGGAPRTMLIGLSGQPDIEFFSIAESVYNMWPNLRAKHNW